MLGCEHLDGGTSPIVTTRDHDAAGRLISVRQCSFAVPRRWSTASSKSAITNQGRALDKAPVRDRIEGRTYNEPQGNSEAFVLG